MIVWDDSPAQVFSRCEPREFNSPTNPGLLGSVSSPTAGVLPVSPCDQHNQSLKQLLPLFAPSLIIFNPHCSTRYSIPCNHSVVSSLYILCHPRTYPFPVMWVTLGPTLCIVISCLWRLPSVSELPRFSKYSQVVREVPGWNHPPSALLLVESGGEWAPQDPHRLTTLNLWWFVSDVSLLLTFSCLAVPAFETKSSHVLWSGHSTHPSGYNWYC